MSFFTKTVTEKQLAANRANAQNSSGPRTPAGREKSSQNALKHGLAWRFKVLEGEDQETFDNLFNQFMLDEQPVGSVETELVRRMAEYTWLRQRASRCLEACFLITRTSEQIAADQVEMRVRPELERYLHYQSHYDRAFARASAELLKRKKERRLLQSGFELQKRTQAREVRCEKQQQQRDEKHSLWVMEAKLRIQHKETQFQAAAAAQNGQLAA